MGSSPIDPTNFYYICSQRFYKTIPSGANMTVPNEELGLMMNQ